MKAVILLATLKKDGLSNTQTLSEFLAQKMKAKGIETEIIKLVDFNILPGTYANMGTGDEWPQILETILSSDIVIFSMPIWWGSHSSEMQKVIERLDEVHDGILRGEKSKLENKVGGIIVTGDSDGAEQLIGVSANFFNAVGIILPPYATLTVLSKLHDKGATTTQEELIKMYTDDYGKTADTMVEQLIMYAQK